jgi:hypothetical protein
MKQNVYDNPQSFANDASMSRSTDGLEQARSGRLFALARSWLRLWLALPICAPAGNIVVVGGFRI